MLYIILAICNNVKASLHGGKMTEKKEFSVYQAKHIIRCIRKEYEEDYKNAIMSREVRYTYVGTATESEVLHPKGLLASMFERDLG
jgi:hypothetical protein